MGYESFGLRAYIRNLSILHVVMESLLWATSGMRDRRITSIHFKTDCSDLMNMTRGRPRKLVNIWNII